MQLSIHSLFILSFKLDIFIYNITCLYLMMNLEHFFQSLTTCSFNDIAFCCNCKIMQCQISAAVSFYNEYTVSLKYLSSKTLHLQSMMIDLDAPTCSEHYCVSDVVNYRTQRTLNMSKIHSFKTYNLINVNYMCNHVLKVKEQK
jgi:hypothetical protein